MTVGLLKDDLTNAKNYLLESVQTIIFDLGEVIVDVDSAKTTRAFSDLFGIEASTLYSFHQQVSLFTELEIGAITENEFRNLLKNKLNRPDVLDEKIDIAWNAMLGETPQKKLDLLQQLKNKYRILALSNTNSIHIKYINDQILARNGNSDCLENYFHHAYYSHQLNDRKPNASIYQKVLEMEAIEPSTTLFVDDRIENIKTAQELKMQTMHMTSPEQFYLLFDF